MSRSQFQSKIFILRHAWLNLWDERMTTGRINQVATFFSHQQSRYLLAQWRRIKPNAGRTAKELGAKKHAKDEAQQPIIQVNTQQPKGSKTEWEMLSFQWTRWDSFNQNAKTSAGRRSEPAAQYSSHQTSVLYSICTQSSQTKKIPPRIINI